MLAAYAIGKYCATTMAKRTRRRITVDLKGDSVQDLADLERVLGLTAVAVIRRGLRLVKILHENEESGGSTLLTDGTGNHRRLEVL